MRAGERGHEGEGGGNLKTEGEGPTVHKESIAFNPVIVTPMALTGVPTDSYRGLCIDRGINTRGVH